MLPTRDPPQDRRPTQTDKVNGWKQISQANGQEKKSRGSNNHIRQKRLQTKGHKERPRMSLRNTQMKNPARRHQHCKYICSQHRSTQIHKENLGGLQETY